MGKIRALDRKMGRQVMSSYFLLKLLMDNYNFFGILQKIAQSQTKAVSLLKIQFLFSGISLFNLCVECPLLNIKYKVRKFGSGLIFIIF